MKRYSDSTLMRMSKADLIEQLRCAEHNEATAEKHLAQQAENVKDWVPMVRCSRCKYHHDCGVHFCSRLGMNCPDDSEFGCSYGVPN